MDPSGKAVALNRVDGKDQDEERLWDQYADLGLDCEPAKKDWHASVDILNNALRPRRIVDSTGEREKSRLQIFDTCPELILELETCRYPKLTPVKAEKRDPIGDPLPKRKHVVDCALYIAMTDPIYLEPRRVENVEPRYSGIGY